VQSSLNQDLLSACASVRVVPVLTIIDVAQAVPLAKALVAGGLTALEITLRTPAALDAIRRIASEVDGAFVGAGTVLNARHAEQAMDAGARFLVSPGSTPTLLSAARSFSVPLLPGAATASEVMSLLDYGIRFMKFFPAEQSGGVAALKALAPPLADAKFCPTGGVSPANLVTYLGCPNVVCVGGSWVAPQSLVDAGDWAAIEQLARTASSKQRS
jgi:2-dehydro-3-deoxyphosphogluconate aldolase / (4S)-4-hydroxy-2-oxoglutarate aldolase